MHHEKIISFYLSINSLFIFIYSVYCKLTFNGQHITNDTVLLTKLFTLSTTNTQSTKFITIIKGIVYLPVVFSGSQYE